MISWLQTNFQKHFRVLFIVLLGVIIVAFVFTIGAAPGIGDGRNQNRNIQFLETNSRRIHNGRSFLMQPTTAHCSLELH